MTGGSSESGLLDAGSISARKKKTIERSFLRQDDFFLFLIVIEIFVQLHFVEMTGGSSGKVIIESRWE